MAGPLQVGDILNLGRLAWDIYRYGWKEDYNASECRAWCFYFLYTCYALQGFHYLYRTISIESRE
jgi:hypothetical protein